MKGPGRLRSATTRDKAGQCMQSKFLLARRFVMSKPGKSLPPELLELVQLFQSCGLNEQLSLKYAKDSKVAPSFKSLAERYKLPERRLEAKQASLAAQLAENGSKLSDENTGHVVDAIEDGRLKSADQVSGAPPCLEESVRI